MFFKCFLPVSRALYRQISNVVALSLHKNAADAKLASRVAARNLAKRWRFCRDSFWILYRYRARLTGAQYILKLMLLKLIYACQVKMLDRHIFL